MPLADSARATAKPAPQAIARWLNERLGAGCAAVVSAIDDAPSPLFTEEVGRVARAVPARQAEFAAGRWCARQALAHLGMAHVAIPSGSFGQPLWPAGYTGSIAHDSGLAVAAVARIEACTALGIDLLAQQSRLPEGAASLLLSSPDELPPDALEGCPPELATLLLFCIKESAIKVLSPQLGRMVDFAELRVVLGKKVFRVYHLAQSCSPIEGHWQSVCGFLIAASLVRAPQMPVAEI